MYLYICVLCIFVGFTRGRLNTGGVKTDVKSAVIEMPVQLKRHSTDRGEGRGIMGNFKNHIVEDVKCLFSNLKRP